MMKRLSLQLMVILLCVISGLSQSQVKPRESRPNKPVSAETKRVTANPKAALVCVPEVADFSSDIGTIASPNSPNPVISTSASNTYGQGKRCFSGYHQVEATNTVGLTVYMSGMWGDLYGSPRPTSKRDCENTRVEVIFWGFSTSWEQLGSTAARGVWKLDNERYSCSVARATKVVQNSPYSKLRVITKATLTSSSRKVTGSIDNTQW